MKKIYFLIMALSLLESVNAQIINFPDTNFKAKLIQLGVDTNNDNEVSISEALIITNLNVSNSNISNLNGIEYFTNLTDLYCSNNLISILNLSNLTNLFELDCSNNQLVSLELNNLTSLGDINCSNNELTTLNFNNNSYLSLNSINCSFNNLTQFYLDFPVNISMYFIICSNNQLTELNLNSISSLLWLDCSNNQITNLDLSGIINLYDGMELNCSNNNLIYLNLKNYIEEDYFIDFSSNENLEFICSNERFIPLLQNKIIEYNYTNCHVNSYCSFTPGGIFYTIQGNNKYDYNNNGCDVLDLGLSNLKYSITNGIVTGSMISNISGNYNILVEAGTHTVTPVLENPTYFTISPTNVVVTFPTQASPFTQNFCVTPNGVHSVVEVSVIPVEAARPGFDAPYKIVYKNKGNQVENGIINLTFDDDKMDYVSSNPTYQIASTNQLSWNYSNLQPFETRTIDVVFNINTPAETLPVNGGDILNYTVNIATTNTDEMPSDNEFTLNQTVVNSFDPNDITCLEGATVSTAKIGDYVHYMIRFENTGSANATNIVVKDVVDAAKYDINTIIPIKGSHDFYSRINGNNVEFIFENINLPFDDATNDGYVSFKIKIKSTLVAGDTFSKNANIYFDYNFPIVTNTATTTIQALKTQDFAFDSFFKLHPNPTNSVLNIAKTNEIELYSVSVYNALGQLVQTIPNAKMINTVDVSNLSAGNYFIKVMTNKGQANTKFVKE